jgi:hypothetical protein
MNTMVHRLRIACTLLVLISGSLGGEAYGQGSPEAATTERVSVASDGAQANSGSDYPSIAASGCCVAFLSYATNLVEGDTNSFYDVFVHNRMSGETELVSVASDGTQGNGASGSYGLSISGDGLRVAFESAASNLVADDSNAKSDIFVHYIDTGTTMRVSTASDGTQGDGFSYSPVISDDGRWV